MTLWLHVLGFAQAGWFQANALVFSNLFPQLHNNEQIHALSGFECYIKWMQYEVGISCLSISETTLVPHVQSLFLHSSSWILQSKLFFLSPLGSLITNCADFVADSPSCCAQVSFSLTTLFLCCLPFKPWVPNWDSPGLYLDKSSSS